VVPVVSSAGAPSIVVVQNWAGFYRVRGRLECPVDPCRQIRQEEDEYRLQASRAVGNVGSLFLTRVDCR
jgi:hypothetical protein